jgi:pimeloyl-ACP methyl ester carboxylesterase
MNDRELIQRVEAADPAELANLLIRATREDERTLEGYFGIERYRRMHRLAALVGAGPGPETRGLLDSLFGGGAPTQKLGNVVFLPGIMGSELSIANGSDAGSMVWLSIWRLARGQIGQLRLARNGSDESDRSLRVRPTGILKKYYGEAELSLARSWNVKTFWYDWRKDLDLAADALNAKIGEWFPKGAPVHLVAHSMGGLVSRTFIQRYPDRWKTMWDAEQRGIRGGRLVMLGTPNQGSFLVPYMVAGLASTMRKLALVDLTRSLPGILEVLSTFVGAWQMLPSLAAAPGAKPLYQAKTYANLTVDGLKVNLNVNQEFLDRAQAHHERLAAAHQEYRKDDEHPDRLLYVAGFNQPTQARILDYKRIDLDTSYEMTFQGDGSVSHKLGFLEGVKTYFVESEHSALTSNAKLLGSLDTLLLGQVPALSGGQPVSRSTTRAISRGEKADEKAQAAAEMARRRERELEEFRVLLARMQARGLTLGGRHAPGAVAPGPSITETERQLEEELVRDFLSPTRARGPEFQEGQADATESIDLGLVLGSIHEVDDPRPAGPAIDAVAVGHYLGVMPAAAERWLDEAISAALPGGGDDGQRPLLAELTERNILRGLLAQPFFVDDPRPAGRRSRRLIAVAGMGRAGTFGVPELIVLSRELCWVLGRMGRDHLATVLIGSGQGNLPVGDAVEAWLIGIAGAVAEAARDGRSRLRRVTFVEFDPERFALIDEAIRLAVDRPEVRRKAAIRYGGFQLFRDRDDPRVFATVDDEAAARLEALISEQLEARYQRARAAAVQRLAEAGPWDVGFRETAGKKDPTRLNVEFKPIHGPIVGTPPTAIPVPSRARYIFSAITATASVPEREVVIDPRLVEEANNRLPAQPDLAKQLETGRVLGELLLPEDLAPYLNSDAPLVLTVDSDSARIHWELVAQPSGTPDGQPEGPEAKRRFLGTYRTLTRQFRTAFAGLPQPSRAARRDIRVLIVADPASGPDALLGAQQEGMSVAELFGQFNAEQARAEQEEAGRPEPWAALRPKDDATGGRPRVIVESLIGPREATRLEVMSRMLNEQYDVLHFAGHCYFNADDPSASGWIFDGRQILSAYEMRRVKQVPRFIFSNACESGITPDRSQDRSDRLAPSFAEAFFAQGVVNFVCTAWPVDDATAQRFASRLYGELLHGKPMHRAMQEARLAAIEPGKGNDLRTWGAYQHYGNPHFRFFDPVARGSSGAAARGARGGAVEERDAKARRGPRRRAEGGRRRGGA